MIFMRPATANDTDELLAWRNDPQTQANSRSTAPVSREDHARWMQFNVLNGYPAHIVMMAESDLGSLGVVRFDIDRGDVMSYEAGITIAPKHRGKGLGRDVLAMACNYMRESTINANIRVENMASRRMFERCGFELTGDKDGFAKYRKGPQL